MTRDTIWLYKKGVVWGMIALVGPFALPFLWLSPHFGRTPKIVITLILIVLTLVMIYGGFVLKEMAVEYGIAL
ncbi:MAG: hypothetical protein H7839_12455 [Magnetococcus sp. YQC-5]